MNNVESQDKQERKLGHPICIDAFRAAGRDCFALIFDTAQLLKAYDIPSVDFISEVFSTTNRLRQLEIIIEYIGKIREAEEKSPRDSIDIMDLINETGDIKFPPVSHKRVLAESFEPIEEDLDAEQE